MKKIYIITPKENLDGFGSFCRSWESLFGCTPPYKAHVRTRGRIERKMWWMLTATAQFELLRMRTESGSLMSRKVSKPFNESHPSAFRPGRRVQGLRTLKHYRVWAAPARSKDNLKSEIPTSGNGLSSLQIRRCLATPKSEVLYVVQKHPKSSDVLTAGAGALRGREWRPPRFRRAS